MGKFIYPQPKILKPELADFSLPAKSSAFSNILPFMMLLSSERVPLGLRLHSPDTRCNAPMESQMDGHQHPPIGGNHMQIPCKGAPAFYGQKRQRMTGMDNAAYHQTGHCTKYQ